MSRGRPPPGPPGGFRLPRAFRIRRAREIRALVRRGKRRRTLHLDVFWASSPVSHPRLGLIVPRHGQTAVARNRLKRRLREIGRTELLPLLRERGLALDLLVRARREAYEVPYRVLRAELVEAVEAECSGRRSSP